MDCTVRVIRTLQILGCDNDIVILQVIVLWECVLEYFGERWHGIYNSLQIIQPKEKEQRLNKWGQMIILSESC